MDRAAALTRVVDAARLAPSVHNTQPWRWRIAGTTLELWADRARQLEVSDPRGRNLVISCGCALHHAVVAAGALGLEAKVDELPDSTQPDLLARLEVEPSVPSEHAQQRLTALKHRRTDRRRFTSWPVPAQHLERLTNAGRHWGADVLAVSDAPLRAEVELLVEDARRRQMGDPRIADETESWIDHGQGDGVPTAVLPHARGARGERASRFGSGFTPDDADRVLEGTDRVLVISTQDDQPGSWLQAGTTLSAVWLEATQGGLSLVPLSQVVEVERTRAALARLLPEHASVPQVLARVGWQQIGRDDLPRTPRRTVTDVLRSRPG